VGNYFKTLHFLGKVAPSENALKKGVNVFKLKYKLQKKVAKRFFFITNQLNLAFKAG